MLGRLFHPTLWIRPVVLTSFGTREPLSGRSFGTRKRLTPLIPAGAPSIRARTRWTMFSERSWSPPEMKIFEPERRKWSPAGVARVATSARLEPACGSVSAIVPVQRPS